MSDGATFVALTEYRPGSGLTPGSGLFASRRIPRRLDPRRAEADRARSPALRAGRRAALLHRLGTTVLPLCRTCGPAGRAPPPARGARIRVEIRANRSRATSRRPPACERLRAVGAEKGIDRRDFLVRAGAGGLSLAAGATVAGCGSSGGTTTKVVEAALRRRKRVAAPIPRTFQAAMRGHVFNRGDPGFVSVAHIYNERFDSILPKAVGRPLDVKDVQGVVRWASDTACRCARGRAATATPATRRSANGVVARPQQDALDQRQRSREDRNDRRRRAADRRVLGSGGQGRHDSGRLVSVRRDRGSHARRRHGPRGSRVRAHVRQPAAVADRDRRRPDPHRDADRRRPLLGAARRRRRQLRDRHPVHVPRAPDAPGRAVHRLAVVGGVRGARGVAGLVPHARPADVDLPPGCGWRIDVGRRRAGHRHGEPISAACSIEAIGSPSSTFCGNHTYFAMQIARRAA